MPERTLGGKVRLLERLASGGMGDVYRGKHLVMGTDVAVKVLEPAAHPDLDAIGRFRSEAHVSALLAHRSVVRVFDLLEEPDGTLALVMELLFGKTLEQKLQEGVPLEPESAVAIAVPILGALEHAHAVGVVHRDVKPGNIFLSVEPDGQVIPKLLDFGVAKFEGQAVKTLDGNVVGTSRYMSPEQVRGDPLDGRSDVFSVGAVLYEAITGTSPFAASHVATALKKVLEQPVDPDDRIPPRLWLVIQKALAKQAYARHASASAFAAALVNATGKTEGELGALLKDERPPLPKIETPATWSSRPGPMRGSSRWVWIVGAAVVAAIVTTAVVTTEIVGAKARGAAPLPTTQPSPTESHAPAPPLPPQPSQAPARDVRPPSSAHTTRPLPSSRPRPVATTPGF